VRRLCAALAVLGCAHTAPGERLAFTQPPSSEPDLVQLQFAAAKEEYEEKRYEDAARRLHALAELPGLDPLRRGSALLQEGVCRIEAGQRVEGQALLRQALEIFDREAEKQPIDPTLRSQAEYWLGEAYDREFRELQLDPAGMTDDALSQALERKTALLLSAQGHFLRCIRQGDGDWAVAAGYRIGEMYEVLHDQLLAAPLPADLTEEQRALYLQELKGRLRILVEKAIGIYQETVEAAQRTGARGDAIARANAGIERLRRSLLESN